MPRHDGLSLPAAGLPVLRSQRSAALTRALAGAAGSVLLLAQPGLHPHPALAAAGFVTIALTSIVQLLAPRIRWSGIEEAVSALGGVLIIGLGDERVSVLGVLWLVAAVSGVLARGGRQHWLGRTILLGALAVPVLALGSLSLAYATFCAAAVTLLLTSGRLTRELNVLLSQARLQADSAKTLLLAGDIASRMAPRPAPLAERELELQTAEARDALESLVVGDGLRMLVQPIVDLGTGAIHAFEALARFSHPVIDGNTPQWFALAERLGRRAELERACMRAALAIFAQRPAGTSLSVNLSAPVLLEEETIETLLACAAADPDGLSGLIIEITEETLARGDMDIAAGFAPLRAAGACLAVDDMGAGYSGLVQVTTVLPRYLKLDRSLITGIDAGDERGELVRALAGYARQVGCHLIAEGVETAGELEAVRALGAPLVQGYVFARPAEPWPALGGTLDAIEGEPTVTRASDGAADMRSLTPAA